jgi:ubiquinone/menaquinone biosynthesis C-methylase UbiE
MNKNAIRINYNHLSRFYDIFAGSEKPFIETGLRMLNIQPGEIVLEIGFGTGQSLVNLAHSTRKTGKVFGIDLSERMFQIANERISRSSLSNQIELHLGDAIALPYNNNSFNAIFISFTLELFDMKEVPLVLGECKRVLRENGRLCVVALEKTDSLAVKIYQWFHNRFPSIVDCCPIYARKYLETTGFEPFERTEKVMWGLPVEVIIARKYGQRKNKFPQPVRP